MRRPLLVAAALLPVAVALAQAPGAFRACAVARNTHGRVFCSLFSHADGFPDDHTKAFRTAVVPIASTLRATCVFPNVPAGDYAVAAFHDENGNGRMERGPLGQPAEGWGVSRNAGPHAFGPPGFSEAVVHYPGGESHLLFEIRLRY